MEVTKGVPKDLTMGSVLGNVSVTSCTTKAMRVGKCLGDTHYQKDYAEGWYLILKKWDEQNELENNAREMKDCCQNWRVLHLGVCMRERLDRHGSANNKITEASK